MGIIPWGKSLSGDVSLNLRGKHEILRNFLKFVENNYTIWGITLHKTNH